MRLLVVAAWEPELARFRSRTDGAEVAGVELSFEALGVGVVEAAIGMTRCIARHRPSAALLLGTCGAFAGKRDLGDVVTGIGVHLVDAAVVEGTAAIPGPMPIAAAFDIAMHDALVAVGAKSVHIANTVGITVDDDLAARLARLGEVEHLEAFAFARACAAEGLPCAASLCVTNIVGARGRAEWLANHVSASERAADVAYEALAALAAARRA
jgi:futalosine hydrolase